MALTERQLILYKDVVDLYAPSPITTKRLPNNEVTSNRYPSTPTSASVSCYRETAPELANGRFYGRSQKEDTVSLLDRVHFDVSVTIGPNYVFQVKTAGDPELNEWYLVLGDNMVKDYRANKTVVYVKKVTKPVIE